MGMTEYTKLWAEYPIKQWGVDDYTIQEEYTTDANYKTITIWVAYENGLPVGNLRRIGKGQYSDMEWRYAKDGHCKAVVAPMAGATNPVDACLAFLKKYKGD